jgi:rubrerythrin
VRSKLEDLRLLNVAHHLEEAFEGLERELESHIKSDAVRRALEPLFRGGAGHQRLEQELARLRAEMQAAEGSLTERDLLEAIRACEAMAHEFYLRRLDDLSDPRLVALFRDLAAEEGRHEEAVKAAMGLVK